MAWPYSQRAAQLRRHIAHGRTLFRIHGDSRLNPGTASEGCIILPRHVREQISASGDIDLAVIE